MPFACPDCSEPKLEIRIALQLPPDDWNDERSLQLLRCASCGRQSVAYYECSRRGADERWHHEGYRLPGPVLQLLWVYAESCPARDDPRCSCAAHRWLVPGALGRDRFPMTLR